MVLMEFKVGGLRLRCPCGEYFHEVDDAQLLASVREHLRMMHPDRASAYTDDDIRWMAF